MLHVQLCRRDPLLKWLRDALGTSQMEKYEDQAMGGQRSGGKTATGKHAPHKDRSVHL